MASGLLQLNDERQSPLIGAMDRFFEERNKAEERKNQKRQFDAGLKAKGLIETPEGGFGYDEDTIAAREAEKARTAQQDQAGLLAKGMRAGSGGGIEFTPEQAERDALERRKLRSEAQHYEALARNGGKSGLSADGSTGKIVPAAAAQDFGGANSSIKQLQEYQKMLTNNPDITGKGVGKTLSRGFSQGLSILGGGNDASNRAEGLKAAQDKVAQVIGKYLEGGKLTDMDIQRYRTMLPSLSDNPQVAAAKSAQLQKLISSKQAEEKASLAQSGYRSGGLGMVEPQLGGLDLLGGSGLLPTQGLLPKGPVVPAKVQAPLSEDDLDNMTDEELRAFLGE